MSVQTEDAPNLAHIDTNPPMDVSVAVQDTSEPVTQVETPKRGRGRPKGSKNKKSGDSPTSSSPTVPKKRGRPPKEKKPEDESSEPAPKRKRGRPPKKAAEQAAAAAKAIAEAAASAAVAEGSGEVAAEPPVVAADES